MDSEGNPLPRGIERINPSPQLVRKSFPQGGELEGKSNSYLKVRRDLFHPEELEGSSFQLDGAFLPIGVRFLPRETEGNCFPFDAKSNSKGAERSDAESNSSSNSNAN